MREEDWGLVCVGVWDSPVEEGIICITGGGTTGYGEGITDETWV